MPMKGSDAHKLRAYVLGFCDTCPILKKSSK